MKYQKMIALFLITVTITGCASQQLKNSQKLEAEARKQALNATISPQQALEEAEELIKQAKREELGMYAPLHMKAAEEAISEARIFMQSKNNVKLLESSFKARQMVLAGVKNKALVKRKLSRSLEQFLRIRDIGAEKYFESEFNSRKEDLTELFSALESGNVAAAVSDENALLKSLTSLEIDTLYKKYVGLAEDVLKKAKDEKADELAVVTYKSAEQKIHQAGEFIKQHYLKQDEAEKAGNLAMQEANHAYLIAKEVKATKGMEEKQAEQRALYIESLLEKIAEAMNAESGIGLTIADQADRLARKATKSSSAVSKVNSLLAGNKSETSAALKVINEKLKAKEQELLSVNNENQSLRLQLDEATNKLTALQQKPVAAAATEAGAGAEAGTEAGAEAGAEAGTEAETEAATEAATEAEIKPAEKTPENSAFIQETNTEKKPDLKADNEVDVAETDPDSDKPATKNDKNDIAEADSKTQAE
ncbi:MAG: hypothetical protein OEY36_06515 [Gammaproteobacteria bacterium]|nr:hypothetical protein [Gammaproteobacteria bacterium]